jgi:glycosyltransferase involved in cell wall biosynthesis
MFNALLIENGLESRVLTFDIPRSEGDLHQLRPGRWNWPTNLTTAARVVGREGILHNHSTLVSYPSGRTLESLLLVAKFWRFKWVETVHDQTITVRFPKFSDESRRLFLRAMTNAATIIAIGDKIRDFLVGVGIPAGKVVVGQPLLPPRQDRRTLPDRYASFFTDHAPVWITIGAFIPLYDFATVAKAFRLFLQAEPAAGLVVVSGRFIVDPAYEQAVRSLLADLSDRVLFVEDVPNAEVDTLLRASSLLVRGAQYEAFGLSRVEAVLASIPVVATDTGQTNFVTIYEHGDVDSLLSAAHRASTLKPDTLRSGAAHYRQAAAQSLDAILTIYDELGAARSPGKVALKSGPPV